MPRAKKPTPSVNKLEVIQSAAEELLSKLEIPATVEVVDKSDNLYQVNVQTDESGLLIGFHGETLQSYQIILGLIVYKRLGEWTRIVVEIGDYRAHREEQLKLMAQQLADQALSSGQPVYAPFLPPNERRIIHVALQDNPDVETSSEGEDRNRRLVVKPKA